jgi:hypothetical protein
LMARGQLKLAVRAGKVSWCSVSERLPSAVGGGPGSTKVRHRRPLVRTLQPSAGCRRPLVRALQPSAGSRPLVRALQPSAGSRPLVQALQPSAGSRPLVQALQPSAGSLLQLRSARGHHPAAAAAAPASIARPPLEPPPPRPAFGQWCNRSSRFVAANLAFRSNAPRRWIQRSGRRKVGNNASSHRLGLEY